MLKRYLLLILILIAGLFFRAYHFQSWYQYGHDTDLSAWIMRDLVFQGHVRLIGQLTSAPGVFIGPLFYYLLVPLYTATGYDPLGTVAYSWLVGLFAIFSFYYVLAKLYGKKVAIVGALLYSISFGISLTEREVVPTTPIFLWSIWFYYCLHLLRQAKPAGLYLAAVLFGLVWHIQLNLAILSLLAAAVILLNLRRFAFRHLMGSAIVCVFILSPFLAFEARHGFSQTRSLLGSTRGEAPVHRNASEKVIHVVEYAAKNANYITWERPAAVSLYLLPAAVGVLFLVALVSRRLPRFSAASLGGWFLLLVGFFVFHPINLSEYYINGVNVLWFIVIAVGLAALPKKIWPLLTIILAMFTLHNAYRLLTFYPNHTGYDEKQALLRYIKTDAAAHGYPCVAFSYITDRGYELGYRYLTWHLGIKTAPISNDTPVYSVVFPLSRVNKVDHTFGSLGLILPNYAAYTSAQIAAGCAGADYNSTQSMFGFVN